MPEEAVKQNDDQKRDQGEKVTVESKRHRTAGTKEGCADGRGEGGLIQPDCRPGPSDAGNANDSPTASSHEGDSDMSDESESETLTDKRPSKKSSETVPPSRKYEAKRKRCFLENSGTVGKKVKFEPCTCRVDFKKILRVSTVRLQRNLTEAIQMTHTVNLTTIIQNRGKYKDYQRE
ncbi:hypothetical protein Bbelb_133260 [Branchiostoma belcheri]|nr:hypothetical protein Bbelb_133260 [Branchiostoma belcheri]